MQLSVLTKMLNDSMGKKHFEAKKCRHWTNLFSDWLAGRLGTVYGVLDQRANLHATNSGQAEKICLVHAVFQVLHKCFFLIRKISMNMNNKCVAKGSDFLTEEIRTLSL